jgi:hypothetical protein
MLMRQHSAIAPATILYLVTQGGSPIFGFQISEMQRSKVELIGTERDTPLLPSRCERLLSLSLQCLIFTLLVLEVNLRNAVDVRFL